MGSLLANALGRQLRSRGRNTRSLRMEGPRPDRPLPSRKNLVAGMVAIWSGEFVPKQTARWSWCTKIPLDTPRARSIMADPATGYDRTWECNASALIAADTIISARAAPRQGDRRHGNAGRSNPSWASVGSSSKRKL